MTKRKNTKTFEITLKNGITEKITLPENYEKKFKSIQDKTAGYATVALYEMFIETYSSLTKYDKLKYQDLANYSNIRTDDICDLVQLFSMMDKYYNITNVKDTEDLGRLYAAMENLVLIEKMPKALEAKKYKKLGQLVCDHTHGFFAENVFYGKISDVYNY